MLNNLNSIVGFVFSTFSDFFALEWRQDACRAQNVPKTEFVFGIFCMYPRGVDPDRTAGVPYAYKGRLLWREGKRTS